MILPDIQTRPPGGDPLKSIQASGDPAPGEGPVDRVLMAREAALRLEASFLSEMLKSAGFGMQTNSFSGSEGEDQFASFQRDAIAEHMARAGGIGLAEHFFNAMMEAQNDG